MRSTLRLIVAFVAASLAVANAQQPVNPRAAAMAEFQSRLKAYADLRGKQSTGLAQLKPDSRPEEILAAEQLLSERMKAARTGAKQGDIFVPEVVPVLRDIFEDYYRRRTGRERQLVFDEVPNFKPAVNMTYPPGRPKGTFPPRVALALPQLPDGLEFRLVGNDLILRDTKANLIVDWIPGIIRGRSAKPEKPEAPE